MKRIIIRLTDEEHATLAERAEKEHRTIALQAKHEVVRRFVLGGSSTTPWMVTGIGGNEVIPRSLNTSAVQ